MKQEDAYDVVIGLEIHVQLDLATKAFAPESNVTEAPPNSLISPVSLALPGTLPVLNRQYLDAAIKLALAFNAKILESCFFDRKHYFYADLPKGYQVTQDKAPYCTGGYIQAILNGKTRPVVLDHIHMEEDAGKSIHDIDPDHSLLDFNRAGTPLLEIVTAPDLGTPDEVSACIDAVQQMVQYLGISTANMEKGMLRCDCNVSLKPRGAKQLGARCEIKNLNSKRHARRAIELEVRRQRKILEEGGSIDSMTMSYDAKKNRNTPIRDKETVHDYRYFPEPDLPVFHISKDTIERNRAVLPPLPLTFYNQFTSKFRIDSAAALLFTSSLQEAVIVADFLDWGPDPGFLSNIYIQKIRPWLLDQGMQEKLLGQKRDRILAYCALVESGKVSASSALQELMPVVLESDNTDIGETAGELGLIVHADPDTLAADIQGILAAFPGKVNQYKQGKKGLIGFFMGELMRHSGKKPDPVLAKSMLEEFLSKS